jgi:hypothetical protein
VKSSPDTSGNAGKRGLTVAGGANGRHTRTLHGYIL